ncbi:MAG TPA: cytochrome c3 family protein [Pyrinomonadaceae bacterium]|nr:cytochrome c3 family protein [Pyrinomonadaceae bacterium]
MKNRVKLVAVSLFGLFALLIFLTGVDRSSAGGADGAAPTPTPVKANTAPASNAPKANAATPPASTPPAATPAAGGGGGAGDAVLHKKYILAKDSLSEYGPAPFDHKTHAFDKYTADGTAVIACVECHHTDAPKSALKAPYVTSERNEVLTLESWRASSQKKVTGCRDCHFQTGNEPEGKTMPVLNGKDLNNELAYHLNCNTCHDAAAKARPALKGKPGFAVGADCAKCHSGSN